MSYEIRHRQVRGIYRDPTKGARDALTSIASTQNAVANRGLARDKMLADEARAARAIDREDARRVVMDKRADDRFRITDKRADAALLLQQQAAAARVAALAEKNKLAQEERDYYKAYAATSGLQVNANEAFRTKVDNGTYEYNSAVDGAMDRVAAADGDMSKVASVDRALVSKFNAINEDMGNRYTEEKSATLGERMLSMQDKFSDNLFYGRQLNKKEVNDAIAESTNRKQANKDLQRLLIEREKYSNKAMPRAGKTAAGGNVKDNVAKSVYTAFQVGTKDRPVSSDMKEVVTTLSGKGYGAQQITAYLSSADNGYTSAKEINWGFDRDEELKEGWLGNAMGKMSAPSNVVVGSSPRVSTQIDQRIAALTAQISGGVNDPRIYEGMMAELKGLYGAKKSAPLKTTKNDTMPDTGFTTGDGIEVKHASKETLSAVRQSLDSGGVMKEVMANYETGYKYGNAGVVTWLTGLMGDRTKPTLLPKYDRRLHYNITEVAHAVDKLRGLPRGTTSDTDALTSMRQLTKDPEEIEVLDDLIYRRKVERDSKFRGSEQMASLRGVAATTVGAVLPVGPAANVVGTIGKGAVKAVGKRTPGLIKKPVVELAQKLGNKFANSVLPSSAVKGASKSIDKITNAMAKFKATPGRPSADILKIRKQIIKELKVSGNRPKAVRAQLTKQLAEANEMLYAAKVARADFVKKGLAAGTRTAVGTSVNIGLTNYGANAVWGE